jgi:hypothetical protein
MEQAEAAVVRAELVALQAVLIGVLRRLAVDRPDIAPSLCAAFDEADAILTGIAIKMGLDAPAETTVGALAIVDQIRRAVIRDESVCDPDLRNKL